VSPAAFTGDERRRLGRLADALIPCRDGMPAASQVNVHGSGADRVAALRPDLLEPARRALHVDLPLDDLRHHDPEAFRALTMLVAAAYLTEPRVQRLLRYPGRATESAGYPDADAAELRELVRPVCERGWHATRETAE
jgi:hypothetical protein